MGRPRLTTSISSTATTRPASSVGSSAPSLTTNRSRLVKKLLLRTTGFLAIVSLIGITTAAEPTDKPQASSKNNTQKATSINLSADASEVPQKPNTNNSDAEHTTSNTTVVNGKASNTSGTSYSVTVNNQPVDVPVNGTNQQTITTPDGGTTTVTVNNSTSGQGSNFSSTSTTTNANSQTQTSNFNQSSLTQRSYGNP